MNSKKNVIYIAGGIIVLLLLFIGVTFAYYNMPHDTQASRSIDIQSGTTSNLTFDITGDISFSASQTDFVRNGNDKYGESIATIVYVPDNTLFDVARYSLLLYIKENSFSYSMNNTKYLPELLLQVFDNNNELVQLEGLGSLKTAKTLVGYDITGKTGTFELLLNHEIVPTSTDTITEQWRVVVTFVNYDFNQVGNANKRFAGQVIAGKNLGFCDYYPNECMTIATNDLPTTHGNTISISCDNATATYNNKYSQIELSAVSVSNPKCTLSSVEPEIKTYLNDYVIGLEGDTNQGDGMVVHETVDPYYTIFPYGENALMTYEAMTETNTMVENDKVYTENGNRNGWRKHKFYPTSDGYYWICYNIPSTNYTSNSTSWLNAIRIYTINSETSSRATIYSNYNSNPSKSGCYDFGSMTTEDYVVIETLYQWNMALGYASVYFVKQYENTNAGYRYEGKNPNNYVWFNNELWRIIGVFGGESHGQIGKQLVKIIKNDSIPPFVPYVNYSTDSYRSNHYDYSNAKAVLNGDYYNRQNSYAKEGILKNYRGMIEEADWYVGGAGRNTYTDKNNEYLYERQGIIYSNYTTTKTKAYIGLIYLSDYMYGALEDDCDKSAYNSSSSSSLVSSCAINNWLYNGYQLLTGNMYSNSYNTLWCIATSGLVVGCSTGKAYDNVLPVLYLSSDVYKISGTGTISNPYIIGM